MQYYHESQRCEEEASDQFNVGLMTHHHAYALTVAEELRFCLPTLLNPTQEKENTFAPTSA